MKSVLVLAILALSADRAYPCAEPLLTDEPLTKDGAVIPNGGGVVMMTVNGMGRGDDAAGARLVAGTTNVEMKREYIAPALTVIVAKPQANRSIELVGSRGKAILKLTQGDVAPKHAAPKVSKIHTTLARTTKREPQQMWEVSSQYTVELAEAPPTDVLALVVFSGANGVAWTLPQKGVLSYSFWAGGKRCSPGPSSISQGEEITIAWLDTGGRLSVLSKPMKAGATPKAKK